MNKAEINAALQAAFIECEIAFCPLSDQQKQLLLQIVVEKLTAESGEGLRSDSEEGLENPLNELTPEQRQALLKFVQEQEQQNTSWKIKLLNDWLHEQDSGSMQFIRDEYGPQWLNRVKTVHLAQYFEQQERGESLKLKVGDRIEVSNALWEWVQNEGPCSREWFPCTVVAVSEASDRDSSYTNCIIRFDNGAEFEIQGMNQWNRYNWRWAQE